MRMDSNKLPTLIKMSFFKILLASVTLWAVAHCSSDVYKKLKGTSIIPIDAKEEKDPQNREDWCYEV